MNRSSNLKTKYLPIAFVEGSLIKQLSDYLKDINQDGDEDEKYGPVFDATKEFLTANIEAWPEIEDSENGFEYQDHENFEIISLDNTGAVIATGGDWQNPMRIYITYDLAGHLVVWHAEFCDFPESGLGDIEILKTIGR